jgi:hypothetical protein
VLARQRRAVEVEPDKEYEEIGIRSFGRGIFHKEPVSGISLGNKRVFRIEPGDLVISNVFAWEGAIALATPSEAGRIGSHRFMTFIPTDDRLDPSWAAWFFLSEEGLQLIRSASPGSAGRNRTLAIDRFESLEIPLPPLEEQRRVATRIDAITESVAYLESRCQWMENLFAAFVASTSSRPDIDRQERRDSGWQTLGLAEVLELSIDQVTVDPGETYDIAGVYSFGRGMFERAALPGSQTSYKVLHRLHAGRLVMSRLKAWEGALAIVPPNLEGHYLSPEFPTFALNLERVDPAYVSALVTSPEFWSRLKGASQGIGARRERVNAVRLLEQDVEFPPIGQQRAIGRVIQAVEPMLAMRQRARERIDALLPAALNEAFTGLR